MAHGVRRVDPALSAQLKAWVRWYRDVVWQETNEEFAARVGISGGALSDRCNPQKKSITPDADTLKKLYDKARMDLNLAFMRPPRADERLPPDPHDASPQSAPAPRRAAVGGRS
jgi:transcriptional regulator with XRE-family HTH domain